MNIADDIYQHGYHIIDHFLDDVHYEELQNIIQSLEQTNQLKQAKIGAQAYHTQNKTIRRDKIMWIDEHDNTRAIQAYLKKIQTISQHLNESLFLCIADFEAHFSIYQPGDFYHKHIDQFKNTKNRRISCVYYLNHEWKSQYGGELKLYDIDNQPLINILPEANRFVCFNSELPHEVCVTSHKRYSIAAWLKTRDM